MIQLADLVHLQLGRMAVGHVLNAKVMSFCFKENAVSHVTAQDWQSTILGLPEAGNAELLSSATTAVTLMELSVAATLLWGVMRTV